MSAQPDLAAWLLARVAEDEAAADVETWRHGSDFSDPYPQRTDYDEMVVGPKRWLAECDAKRRIVELHRATDQRVWAAGPAHLVCRSCATGDPWDGYYRDDYPCDTLRALALTWADRDDYREEWR